MQIVIDVHEKDLECLKRTGQVTYALISGILNGTPLPKGYGKLISAVEVQNKFCEECSMECAVCHYFQAENDLCRLIDEVRPLVEEDNGRRVR